MLHACHSAGWQTGFLLPLLLWFQRFEECAMTVAPYGWLTLSGLAVSFAMWRRLAVPVEILFNFCALVAILLFRWVKLLPGQHFHLYLIGYGAFRFFHEFFRDEPRVLSPLTGYQLAALVVLVLGIWRFVVRQRRSARTHNV